MEELQVCETVENARKAIGLLAPSLTDAQITWDFLVSELDDCNKKQLDMLHDIENGKWNVYEGFKKLIELQNLRKYRRKITNAKDMFEPIYEFYTKNKKLDIDLHKVNKNLVRINELQTNWVYHPRYKEKETAV